MAEAKWLDEAEQHAWRSYRRMRALLDLRVSRDLARDSGLSDADYDVLSTLSEAPDGRLRLKDLADHVLWTASRVSHQLTRMQGRGLVAREQDGSDGRGAVVVLTAAGRALIERAAPDHVASVRRHFVDLLSRSQIEALGDIADRVVGRLDG